MKNNSRIAQSLRSLSLMPSLESDDSSVETGAAGEGVVKVDLEPAQEAPADGAGAPAEDQDLTTTQVVEDKGPTEEAAETVSEDSPAVAEQVSTESEEASASEAALEPNAEQAAAAEESSVVTGDGEQTQVVEVEAAQETPADGEGAPGEDAEVTATIVEVGERSELESAETVVEDSAGAETVSQEGLKGAVKGFAIGTVGLLLTPLTLGLSNGAVDAGQKDRRLKLGNEINVLAKRLADLKNGDIEQAKKEGVRVPKEQIEKVDAGEVVKSFILGMVLPFYSTYQGHKVEELEIQLAAKIAELKLEMAKHNISTESEGDAADVAVAAAAAFAEGAAGAAEAVAAAVDAGAPEVVEEAAVVEAVEEVAGDAGEAAVEAAPEGEAVEAAAEVVEEAVEEVIEDEASEDVELEELDEAIEAGEEHAEKYEAEVATLESLIDALKDAQQTGGLTMQSARFFQISFEGIGTRLTGKPFENSHGEAAVPSLESFGGTMRRDEATRISMESAKEWLAKIWEVLKKTYAQIKEWLVKFFQLVLDKSARVSARAEKVKAAAERLNGAKPKVAEIQFRGAGRIAIGGKVGTDDLNDLVAFAREAGERNADASQAIAKMRVGLQKMVQGGSISDAEFKEIGESMVAGDLRSAVFSSAYKGQEGDGYKTKVLPGNVEFLAVAPDAGGMSNAEKGALFARGWKVVELRDDAQEVTNVAVLTPFHIKEIATSAAGVAEAVKLAKTALKEDALSLSDLNIPADMEQSEAARIKGLAWAGGKLLQTQSSSIGKILKYCINTADVYLDYAVASLKQYEQAAA